MKKLCPHYHAFRISSLAKTYLSYCLCLLKVHIISLVYSTFKLSPLFSVLSRLSTMSCTLSFSLSFFRYFLGSTAYFCTNLSLYDNKHSKIKPSFSVLNQPILKRFLYYTSHICTITLTESKCTHISNIQVASVQRPNLFLHMHLMLEYHVRD